MLVSALGDGMSMVAWLAVQIAPPRPSRCLDPGCGGGVRAAGDDRRGRARPLYSPFTAICTALFQPVSPPDALSRVLATRSALTIPATALGTLLGGPMVTAVGGRHTLLMSALLTIGFGASVAVFLGLGHTSSNRRTGRFGATAAVPRSAAPSPVRLLDSSERGLTPQRWSGGSLAQASVDPLAQQVGVTHVAGVLLDRSDQHLAQRDRPPTAAMLIQGIVARDVET